MLVFLSLSLKLNVFIPGSIVDENGKLEAIALFKIRVSVSLFSIISLLLPDKSHLGASLK